MFAPFHKRIEISDIRKSFGSNLVLDGIDLSIGPGQILSLLGANGAGKSTLMNILCGLHQPDSGQIVLNGVVVSFAAPIQAINAGIRLLPQEISVIPELTVAENIFLGDLPRKNRFGMQVVDVHELALRTRKLLDLVGLNVSPDTPVKLLTTPQMRLVEIARALAGDAQVLVMDEPTASMTESERLELFDNLRRLRDQGTTIIFISHYIDEVFQISDRIAVMKDGLLSKEFDPASSTEEDVLLAMLGRNIGQLFPGHRLAESSSPIVMEFDNVTVANCVQDANLQLHEGEILGLFGLRGSGLETFGKNIFADNTKIESGSITTRDGALAANVKDRISAGIGYLPAERKRDGIIPGMSIADNISLPFLDKLGSVWRLKSSRVTSESRTKADVVSVKCESLEQMAGELSGGNQQKVCLARWIDSGIKILVLEEPTRGVDMGSRVDIYKEIRKLADKGVAVLMVSSDVEEVAGCSDRSMVVRDKRLSRPFPAGTPSEILMLAAATSKETK